MTLTFHAYSDYKDSGLKWLGHIPSHWVTRRGKWLFDQMRRDVRPADEVVTCFRDGTVTLRKHRRTTGFTESLKEIGYQGVRRNDLVIHAMDAFAGAIGVSDADGKCTPVYSICQPKPNVNPYYYAQIIREMSRSQYIMALARGIRERSSDFRFEMFASQFLPVPPIEEQDVIAQFLTASERRLNRLIFEKRKLIGLLNEQKRAIIHRAVTRGLDPNVRLKPSGFDWLGDIPDHWRMLRLRHLIRGIDQGVSPLAEAGLAEGNSWGVLKSGCVNGGVFRPREHKRLPMEFRIDSKLTVNIGDVLVSRACGSPKLVGSVGLVTELPYRVILSDKTFRLNIRNPTLKRFLVLAMNTRYFRDQVEMAISGAEGLANNLPVSSLKDFYVAVPPEGEANLIASKLDLETQGLQSQISRLESEVSLLREYRTRLIADVVTGKLDVRGVKVPAIDEPEELETILSIDNVDAEDLDQSTALDETEELAYADD